MPSATRGKEKRRKKKSRIKTVEEKGQITVCGFSNLLTVGFFHSWTAGQIVTVKLHAYSIFCWRSDRIVIIQSLYRAFLVVVSESYRPFPRQPVNHVPSGWGRGMTWADHIFWLGFLKGPPLASLTLLKRVCLFHSCSGGSQRRVRYLWEMKPDIPFSPCYSPLWIYGPCNA